MRVAELVIVNGYGCDLDSPLRPYLDSVIAYLDSNLSCVIFCGGHTQQHSFPGMSEAAVMASYVTSRVPGLMFALEDESYTTYENIQYAERRVRALGWEPDRITIFCEATRALKVMLLARHFFEAWWRARDPVLSNRERRLRVFTHSWELMDPTLELIATIKDWLAIKMPWVNGLQSRKRRRASLRR